jgi:Sporulation and spore germination
MSPRRLAGPLVTGVLALLPLLLSCGLPGGGSVRTVDQETVPYGLLGSETPSPGSTDSGEVPGRVSLVFWLVDDDRLDPGPADASCAERPQEVAERLLRELAAGPTDEDRAEGRSTAIPPESMLALVDLEEGTAEVEIDPETAISADRLPAAVGQIVLTVTSAPGVRSVALVNDGVPVQAPLPGGALTDGPVTAEDYLVLLPDRYQQPLGLGCPEP